MRCRWPSTARPGPSSAASASPHRPATTSFPSISARSCCLRSAGASCCASCGWPRARTSPRSPTSSPPATARARPSAPSSPSSRWPARCPTSRCSSRPSRSPSTRCWAPRPLQLFNLPTDTALVIALLMATFAVLFGTRHIDATEHQEGLIVAVAAESARQARGLPGGRLLRHLLRVRRHRRLHRRASAAAPRSSKIFAQDFHGGTWVTVTFLSLVCIVLLPRQFHVTVVENNSENEIRRAAWLFPVYLVLINLFVVPIAAAGLLILPKGIVDADMFVLACRWRPGADVITLLAFVGGLSAATAMVIVDSVALAIMVCNGLVVPLLLRGRFHDAHGPGGHGVAAARHPPRRDLRHHPAGLSVLSAARPGARPGLHRPRLVRGHRAVRAGILRRPDLAQRHRARRHCRHRHRALPCGPTRCCCPGSSRPAGCRAPS